jgi:hypothetical protein
VGEFVKYCGAISMIAPAQSLYLNCSRSVYEKWSRDIPGNIEKADKNWLKFIDGN